MISFSQKPQEEQSQQPVENTKTEMDFCLNSFSISVPIIESAFASKQVQTFNKRDLNSFTSGETSNLNVFYLYERL